MHSCSTSGLPSWTFVIVFTGWTLPRRIVSTKVALDRVLEAVVDDPLR